MLTQEKKQTIIDRMQLIPAIRTFDVNVKELNEGICQLVVPRDNRYDGIFESFGGGLLMTVADIAACYAILTLIDLSEALATTDMNIRFLAPCLTDVRGVAKVIKPGRTLVPVHVDLIDMKEKLVAVADVTYMRLPHIPKRN